MITRLLAVLAALWIATPAQAAEFSMSRMGDLDVIHLKGPMVASDVEEFKRVTRGLDGAIVTLESGGGSLLAGIKIGRIIRERGYATKIDRGTICSSACAFAFLGGRSAHLYRESRLGFHAVYIKNGDRPEITSAGNALVGAYLKELGLSDEAIMYVTSAAPESMNWIDQDLSRRLGLGIDFVDRERHWRYAKGYFFVGPNINGKTIVIQKVSDCRMMCEITSNCVAFSVHLGANQCFLKRDIEKVVPNEFFSSARYAETPVPN